MTVSIDKEGFQSRLEDIYGIQAGTPLSLHYTEVFDVIWVLSNDSYPINIPRILEDLWNVQNQLSDLDTSLLEISGGRLTTNSKAHEFKHHLSYLGVMDRDLMRLTSKSLAMIEDKYSETEEIVETAELIYLFKVLKSLELRLLRLKDGSDDSTVTPTIPLLTKTDSLFTSTTLFHSDFRYLAPTTGKKLYSVSLRQNILYFLSILLEDKSLVDAYLKGGTHLISLLVDKPEDEVTYSDRYNISNSIAKRLVGNKEKFDGTHRDILAPTTRGIRLDISIADKLEAFRSEEDSRTPFGKKVLANNLLGYYKAVHSDILSHIILELSKNKDWGIRLITSTGYDIIVEVDEYVTSEYVVEKVSKIYEQSAPDGWYVPKFYIDNPLERIIHIIDDI